MLARKIRDNGTAYSNLALIDHNHLPTNPLPKHWDIGDYFEFTNQTRLSILQNKVANAQVQVIALRQYAEEHEVFWAVLDCLLLEAQILKIKDDHAPAISLVQQAVELAKPAGLLRTFVDEGEMIKELLEGCLKIKSANTQITSYIKEILNTYSLAGATSATTSTSSSPVKGRLVQVEALSKRELEVLQLISIGKTNIEIAAQLFVAKATVKFHVGNIFSKLNVTNRTLAVATARNSGLIR